MTFLTSIEVRWRHLTSPCYLGSSAGSERWKSWDLWMIPSGEGSNLPKCRFISVMDSRSSDRCYKVSLLRYTFFWPPVIYRGRVCIGNHVGHRTRIIYITMRLLCMVGAKTPTSLSIRLARWLNSWREIPRVTSPDNIFWHQCCRLVTLSMCNFKKEKWKSIQKIHVLRINSSSLHCIKRNTRG